MKICKVCKVKFTPPKITSVTCGDPVCVAENSGTYVKVGFVPIDHKGFENLVRRVRSSLSGSPDVTVVYVKYEGFKVLKAIKKGMQKKINSGDAVVVNNYSMSVPTEYLIEDFVDTINEMVKVKL